MEESLIHFIGELTLMLGLILIVAKLAGEIGLRVFGVPPVLGELLAGVIISPYALGGINWFGVGALFELPHGRAEEFMLPLEEPLFFVAQIGAVILLFEAGLETNRKQFVKNFLPATAVGLGGVILPFLLGAGVTLLFGFASFATVDDLLPALFVGVALTATSIGITARVLSDIGHLGSREGLTVLGAAVIDDVLGIVLLSIVIGLKVSGSVSFADVGLILLRAFGFLFVVTVLGSLASKYISNAILGLRSAGMAVGVSIALALLTSAIAELAFGLAMIIGAYAIGLALSETELRRKIENPMRQVSAFVSPIFFAVIGMQVNLLAFGESDAGVWVIIGFIAVLSLAAVFSKVFGSGLPALAFKFNRLGAARIGVGMTPRGEVALIVAGIGISGAVIDQTIFGVVVVMTIVTTVIAPILLQRLFKNNQSGSTVAPPNAKQSA